MKKKFNFKDSIHALVTWQISTFWIILTYDDPPIRHSQSEMSLLHTCENTLEMVGSCPSQTPSNDSVMDYAWKTHDSPAWWKKLKTLATHVTLILHAAEFFFLNSLFDIFIAKFNHTRHCDSKFTREGFFVWSYHSSLFIFSSHLHASSFLSFYLA